MLSMASPEVSGNGAAIIPFRADLQSVAARLFRRLFINTDLMCVNIMQLYVHELQCDEMVSGLALLVQIVIMGTECSRTRASSM